MSLFFNIFLRMDNPKRELALNGETFQTTFFSHFDGKNDSSSGSTLENPSPGSGSGSFAVGTGTDRCGKAGRERPPHERGESTEEGDAEEISFPAKDTHRTTAVAGPCGSQQQGRDHRSLSLAGWQAERKGGKNGGERTAGFVKQSLKLFGQVSNQPFESSFG